ncbi:PAS domain S-box protein [uncultured Thermosynechococcus sp.]|uniref:bifunctional diguanylate cyclase/phosphodiesterase n=1 Tax=uncultured Thermosynechococcus sp. TaxID=436945 RepID=UPI00261320F2|nr:EAL domain-containing protein [uncultured Thermosynechococcus sp.]
MSNFSPLPGVALKKSGLINVLQKLVGEETDHYLETLFEALPVGICLYNLSGQLVYTNPRGRKLLGFTEPNYPCADIEANLRVYLCDSDRPYPKEELPAIVALQGVCVGPVELDVQRQSERVSLEVYGIPLLTPQGQVVASVAAYIDISDRKQQEIEQAILTNHLQEQANRYRDLIQTQTDFVVRSTPTTTITFANQAFCRAVGYSPKEVLGHCWGEFIPAEDLTLLLDCLSRLTPEAPTFATENRLLNPQGTWIWTQWMNLGIFDAQGQLQEIQSVGRDITALKEQLWREQTLNRVTQAIRNSLDLETIFQTAVSEIAQMGLGVDAHVVQYLPAAQVWRTLAACCQGGNGERAIGYEIPDADNPFAAQLKQGEVVAIADTQAIADHVNQTVAQTFPGAWLLTPLRINDQLWGSLTLVVPNRSHAWSAAEISLVRAVAAQLEVAIHQANLYQQLQEELNQRRQVEAALSRSEERLRRTALNLPGALFRYLQRPDGQIQVFYLNPLCETMWGVSAEAAAADGRVLWALVHPEDYAATWESVCQSAATLTPWCQQFRIVRSSGEIRWLEGAGQPERLEDGSTLWHTLVLDITEQRQTQERLREQQAQLQMAVATAEIGFYSFDWATETFWVSETYKRQLGEPPTASFTLEDWRNRLHPEDRESAIAFFSAFLQEASPCTLEFRLRHRDGSYRWFYANTTLLCDEKGQPCKVIGTQLDITERKQTEIALRESEERYRLLAENTGDIICLLDSQGRCLYVSPSCEALLGIAPQGMIGRPFAEFCPPQERSRVSQELEQMRQQERFWPITHRMVTADGSLRWLETLVKARRDSQGRVLYLQTASRDVTNWIQVQGQLKQQAYYDSLTGLPNRYYLTEELTKAIAQAHRQSDFHYALLFVDVDRFKLINDSLGHQVGDRFLQALGKRLRQRVDSQHLVAYFGSDRFVILATHLRQRQEAIGLAEALLQDLETPLAVDELQLIVNVSIGIVFAHGEYDNSFQVLRDADIALHRAKMHQRGGYALFDLQMQTAVWQAVRLEHDLRHALKDSSLQIVYQPFFDLGKRQLAGMEALVRWRHPTGEMISPAHFVQIAEDTDLIDALDQWVLEQACRQFYEWQQRFRHIGNLILSVNISAKTLKHPHFFRQLDGLRQTYPLAKGQLILELTERMALDLGEEMIALLQGLGDRDIEISIDDFGTGYSCLSYLHRLPIHHLKVDRSFVQELDNPTNYRIVEMIIMLARHLGFGTIAEGIETEKQLKHLKKLGCNYGQGYLLSRPLPPAELESLLTSKRQLK